MEDKGDRAPLVEVGTLKGDEFGRGVKDLTLSNNDLMKRKLVHQLVVVTRLSVCINLGRLVFEVSCGGGHLVMLVLRGCREGYNGPLWALTLCWG